MYYCLPATVHSDYDARLENLSVVLDRSLIIVPSAVVWCPRRRSNQL